MSYSRFSEGDCYVFEHCGGYITCMVCSLMPTFKAKLMGTEPEVEWNRDYNTTLRSRMIVHLGRHLDNGHRVPGRAFEDLARDMKQHGNRVGGVKDTLTNGDWLWTLRRYISAAHHYWHYKVLGQNHWDAPPYCFRCPSGGSRKSTPDCSCWSPRKSTSDSVATPAQDDTNHR